MQKKIALLHRYPSARIKETNAAFPYLQKMGIEVLTFRSFNRLNAFKKFFKSLAWIFYSPFLVLGKGYDVIYCDDSFPIYPLFVKLASPKSKLVLRIGDLHLMYYTGGVLFSILHQIERLTWAVADLILPISEEMAKLIRPVNKNVVVVLDPVDPKDFHVGLRRNYGSVMFHGLITKNKGLDVLIQAAKRMPDVEFEIVGDGPDLPRLKKKAPKNVFFHGWVPFHQVKDLISTCAVGVALRSKNRGNEYVVTSPFIQYGVLGKACLVTRRRVFGDYRWQFSGVDEMVQKLSELLVDPDAEGEKLRRYVLEHHDAKKIGLKIWSLLQ